MPQLKLHPFHQQKGAQFALYGEWEAPERYRDPLQEYRAVREKVGLADLSDRGALLVSGKDRFPFLQSLVSNDLNLLSEGRGIYTTFLTAKGRVIADFYLYQLPETLLIEGEGASGEKLREQLMRYKFRSQVNIDVPPWGRVLVAGPHAKELLDRLLGRPWLPMEEKTVVQKEIEGFSVFGVRRSVTGEEDYHLYLPQEGLEKIWEKLFSDGAALGVSPVGRAALEMLRIEAGKPRYGIDVDEHIIPIEAGLGPEAISYTKGCYPGQEVMARIQTYGHVNKHLSGLVLQGSELPKKDDRVFQGEKELGWITSAANSPFLGKVVALGYLRPEIAVPGTAVEVEVNQARTPARVAALPFYPKR